MFGKDGARPPAPALSSDSALCLYRLYVRWHSGSWSPAWSQLMRAPSASHLCLAPHPASPPCRSFDCCCYSAASFQTAHDNTQVRCGAVRRRPAAAPAAAGRRCCATADARVFSVGPLACAHRPVGRGVPCAGAPAQGPRGLAPYADMLQCLYQGLSLSSINNRGNTKYINPRRSGSATAPGNRWRTSTGTSSERGRERLGCTPVDRRLRDIVLLLTFSECSVRARKHTCLLGAPAPPKPAAHQSCCMPTHRSLPTH